MGKIINLHFLTLPRCRWVPVLLGKFPATNWRPVLGMVRATCQPNVTEIGDWLRPYEPYGSKKTKNKLWSIGLIVTWQKLTANVSELSVFRKLRVDLIYFFCWNITWSSCPWYNMCGCLTQKRTKIKGLNLYHSYKSRITTRERKLHQSK